MVKVCSVCNKEKDLEEFNRQKLGKHGRRASCKECQNAWNREWKQSENGIESRKKYKRSELGKQSSKRYRENNPEKTKAYRQREDVKERKRISCDKQRFSGNRIKALERDNYKCALCGSDEYIQVHHIDESGRNKPKENRNDNLENLITLCGKCHVEQHKPVKKRWDKAV